MTDFTVSKDKAGNLQLGSRTIPVPSSISGVAQSFLRDVLYPVHDGPQPDYEDKEGWKKQIKTVNQMLEPLMEERLRKAAATVETRTIAGVTVHVATPHTNRHPDRVHYRIHGGGFIYFGGTFAKCEAAMTAVDFECVTFGLDYRMPPDHPFPAAVEDALAVYREIIKQYSPKNVVISGGSAGGNLAATVTLKIRDSGLPLPGAVGMLTPGTDFTQASDSFETNNGIDNVLAPSGDFIALYAPNHDMKDPYVSPLWADFSKGFPPTFLQSGTRDLLLSDTVRMHRALRRAGIHAELNVWEAMPHGGFGGSLREPPAPEDLEVTAALVEFVDRIIGGDAATQQMQEGHIAEDGTLDVPGYKMPVSDFVSGEFKRQYAYYVQNAGKWPHAPAMDAPKAEWDKFDAAVDRDVYGPSLEYANEAYPVDVVETRIAGIHAAIVTPRGGVRPGNENRVLINFHGGGFFMGRGLAAGLAEAIPVASRSGMKVITVDYRMAPYHNYPAASEDSEAVYRELLKQYKPEQIGVFGCSAGGMLTGQSVVWYGTKGLPRPGAVGLFCYAPAPFGKRGDSSVWSLTGVPWTRPFEIEAMKLLQGKGYMANVDVNDPCAYPASSDKEFAKFPPTLLITGTRASEMSAAVVAHARFLKLRVDSQIYLMEGGQHGSFVSGEYGAIESHDVLDYIGHWFDMKLRK